MTKETKIGLLVGLAFIVLFAIILSEKGPTQKGEAPPAFTIVDARNKPPVSTVGQPLRDAGKLPVESQLSPIVSGGARSLPPAPMKEEQVAQAPADNQPVSPLPDPLASLLKSRPDQFKPVTGETVKTQLAAAEQTRKPSESAISKTGEAVAAPADDLMKEEEIAPDRGDSTALAGPVAPAAKEQPLPIKTEHTVQPGESLGKIAAKYYGRSTPARVEALYKSNRDTLANISSIRAGDKLRIPDLGEHSDAFEPAPDFVLSHVNAPKSNATHEGQVRIPQPMSEKTASAGEKASKPEKPSVTVVSTKSEHHKSPPYEWYEVRKNDTLSRIARRELGNEKYAQDLYKINKDKLSDKHNLKPGTKIRLPSKTVLNDEIGPVLSSRGLDSSEP